jgi:2-methylcitrate dehydratase PrpD
MTSTISATTRRLSEHMADARNVPLPGAVVEKAKHHILDTMAAMISGAALPAGIAAARFARVYAGASTCTIAATPIRCAPFEAALANGMLAHADETDDSHAASLSHPGCAVIPAALAAAENFEATGEQFLRAVALGYDVGPRVTMTLGVREYFAVGHKSTHSVAGTFAAAAAAASLAALDARRMRWVLGYAAQQASGIASWQRDPDHIEKAFVFGGMPARSGLMAALLVASGMTGVDDEFSGTDNYFLAFAPNAKPEVMAEEIGERYELLRSNIKKWSVGSPIQAPLDAIEILQKRHSFDVDAIESVTVRVGDREARVVNNRNMPDVCLQHMVAVMLEDRRISFHASHDRERMADPRTLALRARVELIEDADLGRQLPRREGIVDIHLKDGTVLHEHVKAVRGTSDNPMPRDEVVAKCRDLIFPVLGESRGTRLIQDLLQLESVPSVRALARSLASN